jgi:hypothetical protein
MTLERWPALNTGPRADGTGRLIPRDNFYLTSLLVGQSRSQTVMYFYCRIRTVIGARNCNRRQIASPKHHIALLGIKATYIRFGLIDKY